MSFIIIEENITAGPFRKGIPVSNLSVGTIKMQNNGETSFTLNSGFEVATINGITFSIANTITVNPNSTLDLPVVANGIPANSGSYSIEMMNYLDSNGNSWNPDEFAIHFNVTSGCERYIAIVVDESGSISETEAVQIRAGLTSFINSQSLSNTTLSLIGMSNSDSDLRTDHIIGKSIVDNQQEFYDWINAYGSREVDPQSDYWASGLAVVNDLAVTPDLVIVITDGLQVNNSTILKDLYSTLSQKSHIFVYGVSAETSGWTELITPLSYYLGRTPILKTSINTILNSDYLGLLDFSILADGEEGYLASEMNNIQVGCKANVEIIEENLIYPTLYAGTPVLQDAGSLLLKNKSGKNLKLIKGTVIHGTANVEGLVFKLKNTVIIPANSQLEVAIRIEGRPLSSGSFSELISIINVNNLNGFTISFNVGKELITITDKTSLQSPSLQILAAGSKGYDSTKGIHLRWLFSGELGEKHLPKGDLYTGTDFGFNKSNDFVKVYRCPYVPNVETTFKLDLNVAPSIVEANKALWIYQMAEGRVFYVYFKNKLKYESITIEPETNPALFLEAYGNNLIEIENKKELFFAAELDFSSVNSSSVLRLETLSVAENTISASKIVANRKTYTSSQLDAVRVVVENGRSIRFKASNCTLNEINFEFYSDFIKHSNELGLWVSKGNYGLSENDAEVFERLEPKFNSVHGKWLKYNDGEYVNTNNYRDKWRKATDADDRNIKEVVQQYLELSKVPANPTAIETVSFGDAPQVEEGEEEIENTTEISYLDLLNIAANDYHVARMLGLGCLDIDDSVFSGDYIYVTEYTTFGDLKNGMEPGEVHHLSMSLPTSIEKERLPLPVNLNKIVPGLNVNSEEKESTKITDENGYSFDGKKRYVSLFMEDIMDHSYNTPFFGSSLEFDESTFTFPIYAGVDYKIDDHSWEKPELSHNLIYFNVNKDLVKSNYEPAPIVIPEEFQNSFFNVRQNKTGAHTYTYQGYGINIFSRATSGKQLSIDSNIRPANTLMSPTGINALLITEENPLMFTSQNEQLKLKLLKDAEVPDETYIRILFEYYTIQELLSYSIPAGINTEEAENPDSAYNPNTIYPDNEEIFADYFNIFYRDSLPQIEMAKIVSVTNAPNDNLFSKVTIEGYTIISSGETIDLTITDTNKDRFVGGILAIGDQNYVITKVTITEVIVGEVTKDVIEVEVMNKEVVTSIVSEGDATIDSEQIKAIAIPENRLCSLVENMLTPSNWRQPGPIGFQVQYPENLKEVHREIIKLKDGQGKDDLQVEKTRGIWKTARIEKVPEKVYQLDSEGKYVLNANEDPIELLKHVGFYSLTLEGFQLPQHPQAVPDATGNTVEWLNGIVRLFTESSVDTEGGAFPVKSRKEFKVVGTENIGGTGDLVLYINDTNFKLAGDYSYDMDPTYDEIITGNQKVNYYPNYNVHLLASPADGLTKENIQPRAGESTHYSIFGIRTHGTNVVLDPGTHLVTNPGVTAINYDSKISVPSPMYAVERIEPMQPREPLGGLYATRPDYFKRSTYTFTTQYQHKPHALLHYRADDEVLLSVLYKRETINTIRENLERLGGKNEVYFTDRWQDFLDFEEKLVNEVIVPKEFYYENPVIDNDPDSKYRFPMADNDDLIQSIKDFIDWHNESQQLILPEEKAPYITAITALNQVVISTEYGIEKDLLAIHFIEQAIHTAFVPLTEIPVIYDFINDSSYVPVGKKQTIKDKNGHILKPNDPDLDMAPMMKIVPPTENNVTAAQFTDFNLDGTSQNIYFYGVREMDIQMNFSPFSPFLGPIKLVPSNPPQTPEIKRIMPVFENPVLGIKPAVQIELNPYHPQQKIKKINIYRAKSLLDAQSTRTMTLVKEVLITEETLSADFDNIWSVYDEFEDLESIPFGEGLFYRLTVSREIEYAEPSADNNSNIIIDYTPSQPSKITATIIADNVSPESPVVEATSTLSTDESTLESVAFSWEKTVHNGKYHLYKMNNQGNWEKIHEKISNDNVVELDLGDVDSYTGELIIKTEDNERIYHHFKVIAENSSGMYSSQEKILTL